MYSNTKKKKKKEEEEERVSPPLRFLLRNSCEYRTNIFIYIFLFVLESLIKMSPYYDSN